MLFQEVRKDVYKMSFGSYLEKLQEEGGKKFELQVFKIELYGMAVSEKDV